MFLQYNLSQNNIIYSPHMPDSHVLWYPEAQQISSHFSVTIKEMIFSFVVIKLNFI